jgi:hypothetical protein
MKHDPKLARPQPWVPPPPDQRPSVPSGVTGESDPEARRLWALGLIATCSNQSVLFGEVPTEERFAAAKEILRLSRLPQRVTKS